MQGFPSDDVDLVRPAVEEEEGDDADYDIYLFCPSFELSGPPGEVVEGPCLYGVRLHSFMFGCFN